MYIIKMHCPVVSYLGHGRPMMSKSAAIKFATRADAQRCIDIQKKTRPHLPEMTVIEYKK